MTSKGTRTGRLLAVAGAAAAAGAVVLAACSSGGASGSSPTGAASGSPGAGRGPVQSDSTAPRRGGFGGGAGGFAPAASGVIAALSGRTMQVQNATDGQVAVSYTAKTAFTQTVTVARSALTVGTCVNAVGAASGTGSGGAGSGSTGDTAFTATTITVSPTAKDGSCAAAGFGGRARGGSATGRPSGFPTAFPSGFPSGFRGSGGRPSGFPTGAFGSGAPGRFGGTGGLGGFATGSVSSVTSGGIVVSEPAAGGRAARTVTVTIDSSTQITRQGTATAKALAVGKCVTATGSTASSGAVTATRIALSPAGPDGCTGRTGFGR